MMLNKLKRADVAENVKPFVVPTLEELSPEYANAVALRERIRVEMNALRAEATSLRADVENAGGLRVSDANTSRIDAILSPDEPKMETSKERLKFVLQRLADLQEALDRHHAILEAAHMQASRRVCDAARVHYDEIISGMCNKLLEVHSYSERHFELYQALQKNGVPTTMMPSPNGSSVFLKPKDRYSQLAYFLNDCAKEGIIPKDTVPEAVRQ